MLIWMRSSALGGVFKIFLMGMLVMAVAGLVLMDVGGFFTGNMTSGTVAKGGGVNIGATEFSRTVDRVLARQGMGAREAYQYGLVDNILRAEIQNRLFTQEAHKLGLETGDEAVLAEISKIAAPLAGDGRTAREALQLALRSQGISEAEFIGGIRQDISNGLFRDALTPPPALVSPIMAQSLYRYDNESRKADILVFNFSDFNQAEKPSDEQLQRYYETNKMDFLIPETRTMTLATLKADMVRKNINISDERLRTEYERHIASFTKPARRSIEQIVLRTETEAQKAAEEMKAGKSLKNSSTSEYEQTSLLSELQTPVFSAEKGAVVGPIKTDLGWHVVRVKETLTEQVTPFEEAKERLRKELENVSMSEEIYRTGNAIEDRLAAGDDIAELVREYGLTTQTVGPVRRSGHDAKNKEQLTSFGSDREQILAIAFDYDEGEVAPLIESADGQFHFVRIDSITPDSYKPFGAVKSDIEKRWVADQRRLQAQAKSMDSLAALNDGKTIADVAKEHGVSVRSIHHMGRKSEKSPNPLNAIASARMFSVGIGEAFSSETDNGFVVGIVTDVNLPAAPEKGGEEITALTALTGTSLPQDTLEQYLSSLIANKKIRINQAALQQMYGDVSTQR